MTDWDTTFKMITASFSFVAIVISIIALIFSKLNNDNNYQSRIDTLNERYCKTIRDIETSIFNEDIISFKGNVSLLTDLFAHQFTLWRNRKLKNKDIMEWTRSNSYRLVSLNYKDKGNQTDSFKSIWRRTSRTNKYSIEFTIYMRYMIEGKFEKIKPLRKCKL